MFFHQTDSELQALKERTEAPIWMTPIGYRTLLGSAAERGYLLDGETPKALYLRLAKAAAKYLERADLEAEFFNILWQGWLGPSSPVLSNFGAERGLPISCYSAFCKDDMPSILSHVNEQAHLTWRGGGVASHLSDLRGIGAQIKSGGVSNGILLPLSMLNSSISSISQNSMRRGSIATYLKVDHPDIKTFLHMREPEISAERRFNKVHHAVVITEEWAHKLQARDAQALETWQEILKLRVETGEPYLLFEDAANRDNPPSYKRLGLQVNGSNLCSEVMLATSELYTLVCCLSSLNLALYDDWKDTNTVELAVYFLDAVMSEFIERAEGMVGLEKALAFAKNSRALGLGVMGFDSYLKSKMIPFDSEEAFNLNKEIFSGISAKATKASIDLGRVYGVPDWCEEVQRRNTHLLAVAPTLTNAAVCGEVSRSIEPYESYAGFVDGAKGNFRYYNKYLETVLESHGLNNDLIWRSIAAHNGSVQHLDFLTERERKVFRTARELDQSVLVRLAAERGEYIDQGQSLNLFYNHEPDPAKVHADHWLAYKLGLKSLYYCKTANALKPQANVDYSTSECKVCQ
jgi:ribonucleoside-diphosphate reductase alpha chain